MTKKQDYCPITLANEVIGDRWNMLVIREIAVGAHRFNDIHRGMPQISRTTLSQRLKFLERAGIVERRQDESPQVVEYGLTAAGEELEPIIWDLGRWAARWIFGDPDDEQLDAAHLVWRMHQFTDPVTAPTDRTTVEFRVHGPGAGTAWLVFDGGDSTACKIDPGYDVDLLVKAHNRDLHRWRAGRLGWQEVCRDGDVEIVGPTHLTRAFPTWFVSDVFAPKAAETASI